MSHIFIIIGLIFLSVITYMLLNMQRIIKEKNKVIEDHKIEISLQNKIINDLYLELTFMNEKIIIDKNNLH